jgi:hypothetical protein
LDLKLFFALEINEWRRRWEFTPNDNVSSICYSVSFSDAQNEDSAWRILDLAVQKAPGFYFKKFYFIDILKE